MHDPGFGAEIGHGGEEGLDQCSQVAESFVVSDLLVCEAAVVVGMEAGPLPVSRRVDHSVFMSRRTNVASSATSHPIQPCDGILLEPRFTYESISPHSLHFFRCDPFPT